MILEPTNVGKKRRGNWKKVPVTSDNNQSYPQGN